VTLRILVHAAAVTLGHISARGGSPSGATAFLVWIAQTRRARGRRSGGSVQMRLVWLCFTFDPLGNAG